MDFNFHQWDLEHSLSRELGGYVKVFPSRSSTMFFCPLPSQNTGQMFPTSPTTTLEILDILFSATDQYFLQVLLQEHWTDSDIFQKSIFFNDIKITVKLNRNVMLYCDVAARLDRNIRS